MPEKQKQERLEPPENIEPDGDDTWEKDQREREYYYDDAHGYETYDPDVDNDDEDD